MARMNNSRTKTLEAIYATPAPTTLEWRKIESLFVALGAQVEAKPYQVKDAREFLTQAGIRQ